MKSSQITVLFIFTKIFSINLTLFTFSHSSLPDDEALKSHLTAHASHTLYVHMVQRVQNAAEK